MAVLATTFRIVLALGCLATPPARALAQGAETPPPANAPGIASVPPPAPPLSPPSASLGRGHLPKTVTAPFEHVEGRLAFVKAELAITEAQTPQWDSFAASVHDATAAMRTRVDGLLQGGLPTAAPDRARVQVDLLAARLEAARRILDAGTQLYAVLSPQQKQAADRLLSAPAGRLLP